MLAQSGVGSAESRTLDHSSSCYLSANNASALPPGSWPWAQRTSALPAGEASAQGLDKLLAHLPGEGGSFWLGRSFLSLRAACGGRQVRRRAAVFLSFLCDRLRFCGVAKTPMWTPEVPRAALVSRRLSSHWSLRGTGKLGSPEQPFFHTSFVFSLTLNMRLKWLWLRV